MVSYFWSRESEYVRHGRREGGLICCRWCRIECLSQNRFPSVLYAASRCLAFDPTQCRGFSSRSTSLQGRQEAGCPLSTAWRSDRKSKL